MKKIMTAFVVLLVLFVSAKISAQTAASKEAASKEKAGKPDVHREQHIAIENFPKNMVVNHLNGWGGMTVAINELPAGTDFSPMLEGLKNNSCQVPHWGYIIKGALRLKYDDGKEVVLNAGEVFYMPPGHKAIVVEDLKILDFSPEKEMKGLIGHIEKKVAGSKQ
jgi:mannose-6-phosphate isomerase-like protein (cupin superfamily)